MDRDVLFGLEPLNTRLGDYKVARAGFVITVSTVGGRPLGKITLSPSGEQRGALWLHGSLAGEFFYSRKKWHVYPIENGRIAREAMGKDPLDYLIHRYERSRQADSKGNGKSKTRVAAAQH